MNKKDIIALFEAIAAAMLGALLLIGVAWMLCACNTQRGEAIESNMIYEAATSERSESRHERKEIDHIMLQLMARADSVQSSIRADSVVSADGTRIYGASIVRNYYHPERLERKERADTNVQAEIEQSMRQELENSISEVNSQVNSETSVIAEPPDVTAIVVCVSISVIVAAIIMIRIFKKQK